MLLAPRGPQVGPSEAIVNFNIFYPTELATVTKTEGVDKGPKSYMFLAENQTHPNILESRRTLKEGWFSSEK